APARPRRRAASLATVTAAALDATVRADCVERLATALGSRGRVRVLLHSIAFGNLKLLVPERTAPEGTAVRALAQALGLDAQQVAEAAGRLFDDGLDALAPLAAPPAYPSSAVLAAADFAPTLDSIGA